MRKIEMIGRSFGFLTVINEVPSFNPKGGKKRLRYLCKCACGGEKEIAGSHLRDGTIKSCGCIRVEKTVKRSVTHNLSSERIYKIWVGMKVRCYNKNRDNYYLYGGRGIKVCKRWHNFENFYADMFPTYFDNASIERLDVDGDYMPENCIWVKMEQQAKNKRNTLFVEWQGERLRLVDLAKMKNVNYKSLHKHYRSDKLPIDQAVAKARKI